MNNRIIEGRNMKTEDRAGKRRTQRPKVNHGQRCETLGLSVGEVERTISITEKVEAGYSVALYSSNTRPHRM